MAAIDKVLQDALALSPEDRDHLVSALIRSLEPENGEILTEAEWETAWAAELERRARDIDEGRARSIPYDEAMSQVRARLAKP